MGQISALQYQLRHRMLDLGISANALEKRAGLKPSAVQNILQGKSKRPTALLLQAIANELNCSITDLLSENPFSSSEIKKENETQQSNEWNSKLYVDAIKIVEELLSQRNIQTTKDVVLKYADEVYRYSADGGLSQLDRRFAAWLIDQYFLKNHPSNR